MGHVALILPDGQIKCVSGKSKSSPGAKNILIFRNSKSLVYSRRPVPFEGRFAVVADPGWEPVDAETPITNGAEADGEVVWSRRPDAGVKFAGGNSCGRRWQESPVTEEQL